eukprot:7385179-Prymnesium_polylepis.1
MSAAVLPRAAASTRREPWAQTREPALMPLALAARRPRAPPPRATHRAALVTPPRLLERASPLPHHTAGRAEWSSSATDAAARSPCCAQTSRCARRGRGLSHHAARASAL